MKQKIISLSAGPGSGKSTTAAMIFGTMKLMGYNVELVREYAKDLTWEKDFENLSDHEHVFEEQKRRIDVLVGQVDVIISDSSLFLSNLYNPESSGKFKSDVLNAYQEHDVLEFFITRKKSYNPIGRNQTEDEAKKKDREILDYLLSNALPFRQICGDEKAHETIIDIALDHWRMKK